MGLTLCVSDIMDKEFERISADSTINRAIQLLMKKGLIGLLVVDENGELVGVLSEKECLKVLVHQTYHEMPSGKIKDFMNSDMLTVSSDMSVDQLTEMFLGNSVRRVPVIDSGKLVGQVTRRDLLRSMHLKLYPSQRN